MIGKVESIPTAYAGNLFCWCGKVPSAARGHPRTPMALIDFTLACGIVPWHQLAIKLQNYEFASQALGVTKRWLLACFLMSNKQVICENVQASQYLSYLSEGFRLFWGHH